MSEGSWIQTLVLTIAGAIAGFIDSIAGGGGLITLPTLKLVVGIGPDAIGTNKIVGTSAALVALLVYLKRGHFDFKRSLAFTVWVGAGSAIGSRISPLLPAWSFQLLLIFTCPLMLWLVWNKDWWIKVEVQAHKNHHLKPSFKNPRILLCGLACGIYDGAWGPGGGTLMLLGLLSIARLPLMTAIAASKFANTCSAATALTSYALGGYVHWKVGSVMAAGVCVGAFTGAQFAHKNAARIVRPVLLVAVILLVCKLLFQGKGL